MTNPILNNLIVNNNTSFINMLKNGNPDMLVRQLMNNNPTFRKFIEDNKGKTPDQIAQEHGINLQNAISEVQGVVNKYKR